MDFNWKPLAPVVIIFNIEGLRMYGFRNKIFLKKCLTSVLGVDILCEHSRDAEHQF